MNQGVEVALISVLGVGILAPFMVILQERVKANAVIRAEAIRSATTQTTTAETKRLEAQDNFYDRVIRQNEALETRMSQLEAKLAQTELELHETRRRLEDKEDEAMRLRGRIDEITDQLQAARNTNTLMGRRIAELEARLKEQSA